MDYLPIFLKSKNKRVIICGGTTAAAKKADLLIRSNCDLEIYSTSLSSEMQLFIEENEVPHFNRAITPEDLDGVIASVVASGDTERDRNYTEILKQAGVPVNVYDNKDACDFIMPTIVDRSPVIIAVSSSGATPVLARLLRTRIETSIPAAYGQLAEFAAGYREKLKQLVKNSRHRYRFWELLTQGAVAEYVFAGKTEDARKLTDELLEQAATGSGEIDKGEVYLVGGGPGDPDLLSFRALRLMQQADVVLYDRLIGDGILDMVRREAERIYVGKMKDDHSVPQEEISEMLVKLAQEGKRVLRLKGGDPFTFGRGGEEIEKLSEHGIHFQVVPGITSASGASSYAGIPLTHRDHAQSCVFVTGHLKNGKPELDWNRLVLPNQTIAIYMGLSALPQISEALITHGAQPGTAVAVIANATRPNQEVVTGTLTNIADKVKEASLVSPAMIIVGSVVTLHDKLNWFSGEEV